jgi:UDP-N-acetylmuramoyl-tripeptide--D-alanyl-D-alanine ligase
VTLDEIVGATGGALSGGIPSGWAFTRLVTDSRTVVPGDVFVALNGEHFDGNDFIHDAIARGACVVVCSPGREADQEGVAFIEVGDTLRALGDVANAWRNRFDVPVVAITGSNGKTTTKELLRSILATAYGAEAVLANAGNLNNLIGLPLTLLDLGSSHRAAVVEMGMNAPGEIARLTEIARPTVGMVTCVGAAHLEGVGSIEGVAAAKGELFAGLSPDATAVVNLEDSHVVRIAEAFSGRRIGFGRDGDVRADAIELLAVDRTRFLLHCDEGAASVEIALGGRHNVSNALGAAGCALALGVGLDAIVAGLGSAKPVPMRLTSERLVNGICVVNDAYNANPSSLKAALAAVADAGAERSIVVLGEMLELGPAAAELHEEAGRDAAVLRPALLCVVGEHAGCVRDGAASAGQHPDDIVVATSHQEAAAAVAARWNAGDLVLVKGSRGAQMEHVVEELRRLAGS